MNWNATPPRIEIAISMIAAACLGGAVAFAIARIAPFGAGLVGASAAGLLAGLIGWLMIARVDGNSGARSIEKLALQAAQEGEGDVLLLDRIVEQEVLLLDDPLPRLRDDSRVVRLFAAHPASAEAARPVLGPGEMIARIEDFLGQSRPSEPAVELPRGPGRAAGEEANAALHAALADIRRSLRQA